MTCCFRTLNDNYLCGYTETADCMGVGGKPGDPGSTCEANPCEQSSNKGACCVSNALECVQATSAGCSDVSGSFKGAGTDCNDISC